MSSIDIYYRPSDGEIYGWVTGGPADPIDGCMVATIDIPEGCAINPDPAVHKIDVSTLELIDKTPDEVALARAPNAGDLYTMIAGELRETDALMMPDFPIASDLRSEWIGYRQALRDLSKPDPTRGRVRNCLEMLQDWPSRPDGGNPAAVLLARSGI